MSFRVPERLRDRKDACSSESVCGLEVCIWRKTSDSLMLVFSDDFALIAEVMDGLRSCRKFCFVHSSPFLTRKENISSESSLFLRLCAMHRDMALFQFLFLVVHTGFLAEATCAVLSLVALPMIYTRSPSWFVLFLRLKHDSACFVDTRWTELVRSVVVRLSGVPDCEP